MGGLKGDGIMWCANNGWEWWRCCGWWRGWQWREFSGWWWCWLGTAADGRWPCGPSCKPAPGGCEDNWRPGGVGWEDSCNPAPGWDDKCKPDGGCDDSWSPGGACWRPAAVCEDSCNTGGACCRPAGGWGDTCKPAAVTDYQSELTVAAVSFMLM